MTINRHGSGVLGFPSDLQIVLTREFHAPIQLVFDVMWQPEHLRRTIAPFGEEVTECTVDLRVGGDYRFTFVPEGGPACTFTGTFLEVEPPTRTAQTWLFGGWPDAEAVETFDLSEAAGVTTFVWTLTFRDQAGRDHMTRFDGIQANMDNVEDYLRTLQNEA